jgi:hypothetical protein
LQYIVLVRPSAMLSTMMVVLRPFLSAKAARKLHKVRAGSLLWAARWTRSWHPHADLCRAAVLCLTLPARPKAVPARKWRHRQICTLQVDSLLDIDAVTGGDVKAEQLGVLRSALLCIVAATASLIRCNRICRRTRHAQVGPRLPGARFLREELGVEPGASLTPTAVPPAPSPQRAESLDEEVQLGSY